MSPTTIAAARPRRNERVRSPNPVAAKNFPSSRSAPSGCGFGHRTTSCRLVGRTRTIGTVGRRLRAPSARERATVTTISEDAGTSPAVGSSSTAELGGSHTAVIDEVVEETRDVRVLRLVREDGSPFRPYEAGAHIDVTGPTGVLRQYSLCGEPSDLSGLLIAVKREPDSRGGSRACTRSFRETASRSANRAISSRSTTAPISTSSSPAASGSPRC